MERRTNGWTPECVQEWSFQTDFLLQRMTREVSRPTKDVQNFLKTSRKEQAEIKLKRTWSRCEYVIEKRVSYQIEINRKPGIK